MAATPAPSSTQQESQQQQHSNLPPPQTFDILPPLHELLARIDHSASTNNPADPQYDASHTVNGEVDTGARYEHLQPLEPKDFPNEVIPIKARIRKALKELEKLPDMERTVEEQQEEIQELEERIRLQRGVLKGLGERAQSELGGVVGNA